VRLSAQIWAKMGAIFKKKQSINQNADYRQ